MSERKSYVIHTGKGLDEQIYVEMDPNEGKMVLLGDTYNHKDKIRLAGGLWNRNEKYWYFEQAYIPSVLKGLGEMRQIDQAYIDSLKSGEQSENGSKPPPKPFQSRFGGSFTRPQNGTDAPPSPFQRRSDETPTTTDNDNLLTREQIVKAASDGETVLDLDLLERSLDAIGVGQGTKQQFMHLFKQRAEGNSDEFTPDVVTVEVEKIVEVEVEKIVNTPGWRRKKRGKKAPMAKQRRWRKPGIDTTSPDYIKPTWWDQMCFYLRPGKCRPAIALVGPAGNGKTTAARKALEAIGMDYIEIDCNESMMPDSLLGRMELTTQDGATVTTWTDGLVTRAFREGKAIILNEFDALDPRTALCLQSACQHPGKNGTDRFITLPEHPDTDRVFPVGDCPIIVTMNTYGNGSREYVGRNVLDAATADRFSMITTDYENEAEIIASKGYTKKIAKSILSWANHVRKVLKDDAALSRIVLGNRIFINIADCMAAGMALEHAVEWEFFGRLDAQDRELLESQLNKKYWGKAS